MVSRQQFSQSERKHFCLVYDFLSLDEFALSKQRVTVLTELARFESVTRVKIRFNTTHGYPWPLLFPFPCNFHG